MVHLPMPSRPRPYPSFEETMLMSDTPVMLGAALWTETRRALEEGERLSPEKALRLFDLEVFHEVGAFANARREAQYGDQVFYNVNRHINYSNRCQFACRFCAFSANGERDPGWALSLEQIFDMAEREIPESVTELHIVGGAHPDFGFDYYERLLKGLRERLPHAHLKAFSAVEIHYFSTKFNLPIREVLERLAQAGLDSLPGGGAEIFAQHVREQICPHKADASHWLETHRIAHQLGLRSNATILYGHLESEADRVDHLMRLRELQDETGGFQAIIPLKFHPENTPMSHLTRVGGLTDLQMIAAARLVLDNFDHVKAYWPSLGVKTAQAALLWGADDFDGTVVNEKIYGAAGAVAPNGLDVMAIRQIITEAGRCPVERNSHYEPLEGGLS